MLGSFTDRELKIYKLVLKKIFGSSITTLSMNKQQLMQL